MEEKTSDEKIEEIKKILKNFNSSIRFKFFYNCGREDAFLPAKDYLFLKTQIEHVIEPKNDTFAIMPKFSPYSEINEVVFEEKGI